MQGGWLHLIPVSLILACIALSFVARQAPNKEAEPFAVDVAPPLPHWTALHHIAAQVACLLSAIAFTEFAGLASRPNNVSLLMLGAFETCVLWLMSVTFMPAMFVSIHPTFSKATEPEQRLKVFGAFVPLFAVASAICMSGVAIAALTIPEVHNSRFLHGRYFIGLPGLACLASLMFKSVRSVRVAVGVMTLAASLFLGVAALAH